MKNKNDSVIAPHISKLKLDIVIIVSITHRLSEWGTFASIFASSILMSEKFIHFTWLHNITTYFWESFFLSRISITMAIFITTYYVCTEIRFLIFDMFVAMTKKNMFWSAILAVIISIFLTTIVVLKLYN